MTSRAGSDSRGAVAGPTLLHNSIDSAAGGAYVPTVFVGMYAPLPIGRAQTCQKTARVRHPRYNTAR